MSEKLLITRDFDLSKFLIAARGLHPCGTPSQVSDYAAELYEVDEHEQCRKRLAIVAMPTLLDRMQVGLDGVEIEHDEGIPLNWPWADTLDPTLFYLVRWGPLQYVWTSFIVAKEVEIPGDMDFTPPPAPQDEWRKREGGSIYLPPEHLQDGES